jgi:hypothetical protein
MATVTGNDNIQIERDNADVDSDLIDDANNDANNDGNDQDTTGTAQVTGRAARSAAGGAGQPASTSGWNRIKSQNSLARKARTPFQLRISSGDWRIWPKQTDGRTPKHTTISPTHSGIRLENGFRQWPTGTTMSTSNPSGPISRRFSSTNMQSKQTKG